MREGTLTSLIALHDVQCDASDPNVCVDHECMFVSLFPLSVLPLWPLCASVACFGSCGDAGRVRRRGEHNRCGSEGWVRGQLDVSVCALLCCVVGCYGNLCVC